MSLIIKSNPQTYYSAQGDLIYVVYDNVRTTPTVTGVTDVAITNAGSGLTDGTYDNVAGINVSGGGTGVNCSVTVSGGVVTSVIIMDGGSGYAVNDTFRFAVGFDHGGTGTGEIITVTSIGNTYQNFKYICEVFINGGNTPVATIKRVPQPDTLMGVFNIGDIVRNYVVANFNPAITSFHAQETGAGEWYVNVQCKFGEEYSFTEFKNITPDSTRTFFNHYNGRMLGVLTNLSVYTDKVVSNRPLINYVNSGDVYCFLPYFPSTGSTFNIVTKPYAGTTLQATNTRPITPIGANYLQIFNVSPDRINGVDASTTYYTVQVNGGDIYTFNLTCEAVYTNYTVHFVNRFGGFDSRNFNKVSRKTIDITKSDFTKLPYTVDASGNVGYYNGNRVYNETRSTYASVYKEKMTLNTDILTDEEYLWLADLIISPLVYMQMDGYFIPVAVTGNNYEFKKRVNDKLTNLTISIEFGDQFNAQYR